MHNPSRRSFVTPLTLSTLLAATPVALGRDFGVDVSHYQGASGISPSWYTDMKAAGGSFAYIKATEGLTGPDDAAMAANVANAGAAGVLTGVYHFAHAENRPTTTGAVQEADHLLTYAGGAIGPGHLRPVLDIEGNALNLSTTALTDWILAFVNEVVTVKGAAAAPIVYLSSSAAAGEVDARVANLDLWVRYINSAVDPSTASPPTGQFHNWAVWQYSAAGSFEGISPLDLDVVHTEYKSLSALVIPEPTGLALAATSLAGLVARRPLRRGRDRQTRSR